MKKENAIHSFIKCLGRHWASLEDRGRGREIPSLPHPELMVTHSIVAKPRLKSEAPDAWPLTLLPDTQLPNKKCF